MIRIIDIEGGKDFELPPDFKISFEETNPMLSESGSYSLPITLPYTPHNARMLTFPNSIDRQNKFVRERNVMVSAGIYQKVGRMIISSIHKESGVTATILVNESKFYETMRNTMMPDFFNRFVRTDFNGSTSERVVKWMEYLDKIMVTNSDKEIAIFPAMIYTDMDKEININDYYDEGQYSAIYDFVNHVAVQTEPGIAPVIGNIPGEKPYFRLSALQEITEVQDGVNMKYPVGYMVTPFLRLNFVISRIFSLLLGGGFYESQLEPFKNIVILNNNLDSVLYGKLNYGQLVPTCSVADFLKAFSNKFGCEFIRDKYGYVKIIFWKDILDRANQSKKIDKVNGRHTLSVEPYKSLKLSRNYPEFAYKKRIASYKEFKEKFPTIQDINYQLPFSDGNYFNKSVLCLVKREIEVDTWTGKKFAVNNNYSDYSFDYYDEKKGYDVYEKKSDELYVEMLMGHLTNRRKYSQNVRNYVSLMPRIPSTRQLNSYLNIGGKTKTNNTKDCPIMFCFTNGRQAAPPASNSLLGDDKLFFGSTYGVNNVGERIYDFDLNYFGEHGLYEKFWKSLDLVLQNSFHTIILPISLTPYEISNFSMLDTYLYKNQPLLCESLKYEITNDDIKVIEAKFKTIKLYD